MRVPSYKRPRDGRIHTKYSPALASGAVPYDACLARSHSGPMGKARGRAMEGRRRGGGICAVKSQPGKPECPRTAQHRSYICWLATLRSMHDTRLITAVTLRTTLGRWRADAVPYDACLARSPSGLVRSAPLPRDPGSVHRSQITDGYPGIHIHMDIHGYP